jgi:hypothetical protein
MEAILFTLTMLVLIRPSEMTSECESICKDGYAKNTARCAKVQNAEDRFYCHRTAKIVYDECVAKCSVSRGTWMVPQ